MHGSMAPTHRDRQVVKANWHSVHKSKVVQASAGQSNVGGHPVATHICDPTLCVVVTKGHRRVLGVFWQAMDIDLDSWGGLQ